MFKERVYILLGLHTIRLSFYSSFSSRNAPKKGRKRPRKHRPKMVVKAKFWGKHWKVGHMEKIFMRCVYWFWRFRYVFKKDLSTFLSLHIPFITFSASLFSRGVSKNYPKGQNKIVFGNFQFFWVLLQANEPENAKTVLSRSNKVYTHSLTISLSDELY